MSWTVTWRPGERDFLIERQPPGSAPLVVVRPTGDHPCSREAAESLADMLHSFIEDSDEQVAGLFEQPEVK